jgi:hypothetical protein
MPVRVKKYYSIYDYTNVALKQAAPTILVFITVGFLLNLLAFVNKTSSGKNYDEIINTVRELISLNFSLTLFFLFLMAWAIYFFILLYNPMLFYTSRIEDWILRKTNIFVISSSSTFGVILSARLLMRIFQVLSIKPTKDLVDIGNINHEIILIFLWVLIFLPHYWFVRHFFNKQKYADSRIRLYGFQDRLALLLAGAFISCISGYFLYFLYFT